LLIAIFVLLCILVLYAAWLTEKTRTNTAAIATMLTQKKSGTDSATVDQPRLGYEWHEDGWPQLSPDEENNQEAWVPFANPRPFQYMDAYGEALLMAEFKASPAALERKAFLKRFFRTCGDYLPISLVDAAAKDDDLAVRVWAAAHINLIYKDYSGKDWDNAPIIRDFTEVFAADVEPIVRAALWSNPDHPKLENRLFHSWGVPQRWEELVAGMSTLDRLALVRNPDISSRFIVSLMKAESDALSIPQSEHIELLSAALLNPRPIQLSRRFGRDFYLTFGDGNPPDDVYEEIWNVAVERWLETPIPYRVFNFIQTTPKVKLATYQRLAEEKHWGLRKEILRGSDPSKDRAVLKLGLADPKDSCKWIAEERCGDYRAFVKRSN
jgi:hypothetical protein